MDLKHTQWDTFRQNITFRQRDGAPIILSWVTIYFTLAGYIAWEPILQKKLEILSADEGKTTLFIPANEMNIKTWSYYYDIELRWDSGIVETPVKWKIEITYQITK